MAASAGLSVGGGLVTRGEGLRNEAAQAEARNADLRAMMLKQTGYENDNRNALATSLQKFQEPAQDTTKTAAETTRANEATANITPVSNSVSEIPLSGDTPQVIRSAVADRMKDAFDKSTDVARERAKLGAFGDTWGANNREIDATGRNINTTNNFSKTEAAMLPDKQALSAYIATKRPTGIGGTMQALGNLGMSYAGSQSGKPAPIASSTSFYNNT